MASPTVPEKMDSGKKPPENGGKPSFESAKPSKLASLREEVVPKGKPAEKPTTPVATVAPSGVTGTAGEAIVKAPDTPEVAKTSWSTFTNYCQEVMDYYHAVEKERGTVSALGATIVYALQRDWTAFWHFLHGEEGEVFLPHISEEIEAPVDSRLESSVRTQLEGLLADPEKKTWVDYAKEIERSTDPKYGGVPAKLILSFARFESSFNPFAVPKNKKGKLLSSAKGLGQFLDGTFAEFQREVPEFANAVATDVKAGLAAIAWYAKKNALRFGIALTDLRLVQYCYEAHHEGPGGFLSLMKFRRGEKVPDSQIPKTYRGRKFPSLGFPEAIWTFRQYAELITAMSSRVQTVADLYASML